MKKKSKILEKIRTILGMGPSDPKDPFSYEGPEGEGEKAVENDSDIAEFEYRYIGSIGANSHRYHVKFDEPAIFTLEGMQYPFGEVSMEVDANTAAQIAALYKKHNLRKWNGYDRTARHVLDGDGFTLKIKFRDGKQLHAHGSNAFPKGYREFRDEMREIFKPLVAQIVERENRKIIERGVSGKITSVLANFIQRGNSGRDEYKIFVLSPDLREKNCDVHIVSDSGTYFEEGKLDLYVTLTDTPAFFEKVDALIKKYDIMQWYGWEKAAEDYNNEEWFQVSFSYEGGNISAHGTLHPENYDAFREELIRLIKDSLQERGLLPNKEEADE